MDNYHDLELVKYIKKPVVFVRIQMIPGEISFLVKIMKKESKKL